jgi:hypothetical protein
VDCEWVPVGVWLLVVAIVLQLVIIIDRPGDGKGLRK